MLGRRQYIGFCYVCGSNFNMRPALEQVGPWLQGGPLRRGLHFTRFGSLEASYYIRVASYVRYCLPDRLIIGSSNLDTTTFDYDNEQGECVITQLTSSPLHPQCVASSLVSLRAERQMRASDKENGTVFSAL